MKTNCTQCNKEFDKKPSQIKKTKNDFCSRSHAATYNNSKYPKRHKQPSKYKCTDCGKRITHNSGRCHRCRRLESSRLFGERILKDVFPKNGHNTFKFHHVRRHAKIKLDLNGRNKICEECGWDIHVHVAHIKPLNSFSIDTKIKIVNDFSNLKYLCPNCHWVFDH